MNILDDYDDYSGFGDGYSKAFTTGFSSFGGNNGSDLEVIQSSFDIACRLSFEISSIVQTGTVRFKIDD